MNLAIKNIILGVGGYVIRHPNIRAMENNFYRFDGRHLSNVHLNTIQGALESFLLHVFLLSDIPR